MKSLLKVTRKAELGLLLVSELALHPGELISLEAVSKKTGASRKFLEQVAGELRRAKIVEGLRGAAGGYRLTRDPKALSVAEVLNAVEGPMEIDACTAHLKDIKNVGRSTSQVAGPPIILKIQGQVMATLMNTTISELA